MQKFSLYFFKVVVLAVYFVGPLCFGGSSSGSISEDKPEPRRSLRLRGDSTPWSFQLGKPHTRSSKRALDSDDDDSDDGASAPKRLQAASAKVDDRRIFPPKPDDLTLEGSPFSSRSISDVEAISPEIGIKCFPSGFSGDLDTAKFSRLLNIYTADRLSPLSSLSEEENSFISKFPPECAFQLGYLTILHGPVKAIRLTFGFAFYQPWELESYRFPICKILPVSISKDDHASEASRRCEFWLNEMKLSYGLGSEYTPYYNLYRIYVTEAEKTLFTQSKYLAQLETALENAGGDYFISKALYSSYWPALVYCINQILAEPLNSSHADTLVVLFTALIYKTDFLEKHPAQRVSCHYLLLSALTRLAKFRIIMKTIKEFDEDLKDIFCWPAAIAELGNYTLLLRYGYVEDVTKPAAARLRDLFIGALRSPSSILKGKDLWLKSKSLRKAFDGAEEDKAKVEEKFALPNTTELEEEEEETSKKTVEDSPKSDIVADRFPLMPKGFDPRHPFFTF